MRTFCINKKDAIEAGRWQVMALQAEFLLSGYKENLAKAQCSKSDSTEPSNTSLSDPIIL